MQVEATFVNSIGMRFVRVPLRGFVSGPFAGDPCYADTPVKNTVVFGHDICMQDTVATVGDYEKFVRATGFSTDYGMEYWQGGWKTGLAFADVNNRGADKPVTGVSYHDAHAFIDWLSVKEGVRYRLMTEAEYEFASRAGCTCSTHCARVVNMDPALFRKDTDALLFAHAVRASPPNALGLYDLNGSVWQWCEDWYAVFSGEKIDGNMPMEKINDDPILWNGLQYRPGAKVIRGGSFSYPPAYAACTNRHFSYTTDRNNNVGFRLVVDIQ